MPRLPVRVVLLALLTLVSQAAALPAPAAVQAPAAVEDASDALVQLADEVAKEVEALRGWSFKEPVKKQVCTPEHVRAYLEREIEKQHPPDKVLRLQAMLRTVGLLPPGWDLKKTYLDILQEQAAGFYDAETRTLYLVKRGGPAGPFVDRLLLAHELTHALDDQQVGLQGFLKPLTGRTEDMDLVVASVLEGSATGLMSQYMARAQLSGRFNLGELQAYAEQEAAQSRRLLEAPRYFSTIVGAYLCGMQFLARGNLVALMLAPDNKAVGRNFLAAVKDPPRSTEQILHPEKYWDADKRDEPVLVDDAAAAKVLAGPVRWVVHQDTLGEMLCAILTTPPDAKPDLLAMPMAEGWTSPAARGWGGDRFYLVCAGSTAEEAARTVKDPQGLWITLWDTPADRDEFLEALEKTPAAGERSSMRLGNLGAVIFYGFNATRRKALEERLEQMPPPMTRGGKPWSPWSL